MWGLKYFIYLGFILQLIVKELKKKVVKIKKFGE